MAARVQFAPLFFSFHHPRYQHLFMCDILQRLQVPEELKHSVSFHKCFILSDKDNAGQGGDFVHDEISKRIKALRREIRSNFFMNDLTKVSPVTSLSDAEIAQSLSILNIFQKKIMKVIDCSS